jgi:nitrogen-specific signal transduction histidine kinase
MNEAQPNKLACLLQESDIRSSIESIMELNKSLVASSIFEAVMKDAPTPSCILQEHRQIVYGNAAFAEACGVDSADEIIGLRPGEALQCINLSERFPSCGATEHCHYCGAFKALSHTLDTGERTSSECIVQTKRSVSFEVNITIAPLQHNDKKLAVFYAEDLSEQHRREALEKIFFHGILNALFSLRLQAQLATMDSRKGKAIEQIGMITEELSDTVAAQESLLAAEGEKLSPEFSTSTVGKILQRATASSHCGESGIELCIQPDNPFEQPIKTDPALLCRILTNMIRNATEASQPGNVVMVGVRKEKDGLTFSVHNETYMEPYAQQLVFTRSFSTKGSGRGLGTYAMKLLGEKYLGGNVWFTSTPDEGTTFHVSIPED